MEIPWRDELIRIYATTQVEGIGRNPEYVSLCNSFNNDLTFGATRDDIEMTKVLIEGYIQEPSTPREQLRSVLGLLMGLHRERDIRHRDICRELVNEMYRKNWTESQNAYFEDAYEAITVEYDFFLSFTTRYPYVNRAYRCFIQHELPEDVLKSADETSTNLLAEAIFRLLKKPPLQGFYFPDSQYDNAETAPKIMNAAGKSRVFIQLIQNIMFEKPAGNNYCFDEYIRAKSKGRPIVFVVGEKSRESLTDGFLVPTSYKAWHDHVTRVDPPYLQEVDFPDESVIKRLKEAINKISKHIDLAINRIQNDVPS